jgi:hypothetical protein
VEKLRKQLEEDRDEHASMHDEDATCEKGANTTQPAQVPPHLAHEVQAQLVQRLDELF